MGDLASPLTVKVSDKGDCGENENFTSTVRVNPLNEAVSSTNESSARAVSGRVIGNSPITASMTAPIAE